MEERVVKDIMLEAKNAIKQIDGAIKKLAEAKRNLTNTMDAMAYRNREERK